MAGIEGAEGVTRGETVGAAAGTSGLAGNALTLEQLGHGRGRGGIARDGGRCGLPVWRIQITRLYPAHEQRVLSVC
ncbi:hypothetical protein [Streptomyces sp. CAI-85]|uniref:hypothetical protein n=1 Tax=Streptomyces sp. CAI-85 TaxID=1472662 RepID=UPI001587CA9E|nr:hypothetical protein [Streptomyces sp. CAI-85]NUV65000.1 hypothetical protein [Streptomyces sp. CAI-85]